MSVPRQGEPDGLIGVTGQVELKPVDATGPEVVQVLVNGVGDAGVRGDETRDQVRVGDAVESTGAA